MRETVLGGGGVSTFGDFDKDACLFAFDRPPRTYFWHHSDIFAPRQASPRAKMGQKMTTVVLKRPNLSTVRLGAERGRQTRA
jgi:hypothetical protein